MPTMERSVTMEVLPQHFVGLQWGRAAERDELMTVLEDLSGLRVRGRFNGSVEGTVR